MRIVLATSRVRRVLRVLTLSYIFLLTISSTSTLTIGHCPFAGHWGEGCFFGRAESHHSRHHPLGLGQNLEVVVVMICCCVGAARSTGALVIWTHLRLGGIKSDDDFTCH